MPYVISTLDFSLSKTAIVLLGLCILGCLDLTARSQKNRTHYVFGAVLGTVLAFALMETASMIVGASDLNGAFVGLGVLGIVILWRMLFGMWDSRTKATVLGSFVFWIAFSMLASETPEQRIAHLTAIGVALIPAVVWCALFLPYHRERRSAVLCMFFAGMLSTIPVLFYDALLRHGVSLHFFLFRIEPESFSVSSQQFVASQWPMLGSTPMTVASMFLSFLLVGFIEEGSKFWVMRKTGAPMATSIDDVLQFSIVVAIGFAFAENVTKTGYFLGFVRQYLMGPEQDWAAFLGNVAGRSVLTSMVHIVSTGIMGYFYGIAMFATPYLKECEARGIHHRLSMYLHKILGVESATIFRRQMILTGFFFAIVLHALSNFLVSVPDVLPGNPRTIGELLQLGDGSPLNLFPLLLIPTFLYVVGGFFLLTSLFLRKENMKERGHLISVDTFVSEEAAE